VAQALRRGALLLARRTLLPLPVPVPVPLDPLAVFNNFNANQMSCRFVEIFRNEMKILCNFLWGGVLGWCGALLALTATFAGVAKDVQTFAAPPIPPSNERRAPSTF